MNIKAKTLIGILFLSINAIAQQSEKLFVKNEILEDLEYLCESIEDAHYNLFAYISKIEFNTNYNTVKSSVVKDSLNTLQTINIFQRVISSVNNGHTEIDFPVDSYKKYANAQGTVFPLEIAFENNKNLIRKNFSDQTAIKIGSEILSINGTSIQDVLNKIYPLISAERIYLKHAKIELYSFPRLYWQAFGQQDNFEIEIKEGSEINTHKVNAVNLINDFELKRNDVMNAKMAMKFFDNFAYLNPGDFSGDENNYQKFIDSSFIEINNYNRETLVIDLRNNRGGNDSFSDYLVSYIANKPFKWNSKLKIKTSAILKEYTRKNNDTTDVYFKNILNHKNGEIYVFPYKNYQPQPKNKRFKGKIYVLINRQSYSQAAVTAAQIQDYKLATLIGEETGDYSTLYASQFQYALPNTGIIVKVSKGQIACVNGNEKQQGVIPDIFIKDHLLDDEDEVLSWLLNKYN